ncbi:alpha/beta fold hydrolase [Saccharothrix variisporea]|uniref:4,5:9,10-diseco-3-hydroxy-5,9, 17-trioxoandrosta-1(10),2-diene-4-oate hydrolase n=1 Tax=Saccharothrix variisporea TaxID=543527 RepID=A0A495XAE2_9PSEU|nr:alpha/beta fold hydrolase [Saccharothrix variisporea]RKT70972.1 4,5:9,10-diseco-3-hydroxy-5,9,17-trioxoandrosta-1(10),2-diene-4-oate hydrolase [Saccharothrix variisporea]
MTKGERGGVAIAAVLLVDAVVHLYWATGARWPAPDEFALSVAVLGFGVDFRPGLLVPLAGVLLLGALVVWGRVRWSGWWWRAGTAVVVAGLGVRGLLGVLWALPGTGRLAPVFLWTNLAATALCLALAVLGFRLVRGAVARGVVVGVPAVVVGALVAGAYVVTPDRVEYRPEQGLGGMASRYVDTPVARFHYVREGDGPPVVLLSPGASWVAGWGPQIKALAATHTVYAVDLPGQGFTEAHDVRFDLDGMTAAVDAFLGAVGVERAVLAGNSWSGGWALAYAQRHPERVTRLVLLAPSGLDRPDPVGWEVFKLPVVGRALARLGAGSREAQEAGVRGLFVHQDAVTAELVDGFVATNTFPDNVRSLYELEAGLDWSTVEAALPTTRQPTLVVWGRQDTVLPVANAAVFAERLPDARVTVLDDCGHALPLDCAEPVTALVEGFLRER